MIFLLDNYDSFTYNLYDYLSQLGAEVMVKRNDEISVEEIKLLSPQAIVISPGPKTPEDAGITLETINYFHKSHPILGICLGYQALGQYFGAKLIHSTLPFHGKTSKIYLENDPIFVNIAPETEVMRYHSLNIENIPSSLKIIASTVIGNEPMALKHLELPLYGLQFHPESILTTAGFTMLRNWFSTLNS